MKFKSSVALLVLGLLALPVGSVGAENVLRLLDYTDPWRFQDSGTDLGTGWTSTSYNDASWSRGSGVLGYPDDEDVLGLASVQTLLSRNRPGTETPVVTYYFRTTFDFPSNTSRVLLVASNLVDDGAVFYLNGTEVGRLSLAAGPVSYSTLAARDNDIVDTFHRLETRFFPSNSLVLGRNVLAVELHQGPLNESNDDAIFGMQLLAFLPLPPEIINQPDSQTNHPSRTAVFSVGAQGRTPLAYQWTRNGTNLTNGGRVQGATSATLTITNLSFTDSANYRVRVTNSFGAITSTVAVLTVVPDVQGPELLSATVDAPANRVVVKFNEPLSSDTATNPANYRIANFGCTPAQSLTVSNAMQTNAQSVVLVIGPYRNDCQYVLTVNDVADTAIPSNAILPDSQAVILFTFTTNIFGMSQAWRFNQGVGFDCATDLGTAWKETDYVEDFSWGGPVAAILYFDAQPPVPCSGSLNHQLSAGCNAYYFRTKFVVTNIPPASELILRHYLDDGAVFYLNGQEIYRFNMPSGAPTYSMRAPLARDPACIISPPISNPPLVRGTNLLAVEVHQNEAPGAQGEDVSFGTILDLVYYSPPMDIPELGIERQGPNVALSWSGTGFTLESKTRLSQTIWTTVPTTTNRLVTPASGPMQYFRLR